MPSDEGPTKWVDEWPLPGLSAVDRMRIKAVLLKAHATYHRGDWRDSLESAITAMQQAFGGIASILFDANLLTLELLQNELRLFLVESSDAGNWLTLGGVPRDGERTEIFPGYLGNAERWKAFNGRLWMIFAAEIAEWHGKLLEREAEHSTATKKSRQPVGKPTDTEVERRAKLLADYKAATGNPSSKRIYEAENCPIHKPQFHRWLRAELPANSKTTKDFERFLREKRRPIPKN
jgi:hypothetical protein